MQDAIFLIVGCVDGLAGPFSILKNIYRGGDRIRLYCRGGCCLRSSVLTASINLFSSRNQEHMGGCSFFMSHSESILLEEKHGWRLDRLICSCVF